MFLVGVRVYESETQGSTDLCADALQHGVYVITIPWLCCKKRMCFLKNGSVMSQLAVLVCSTEREFLSTEYNCRSHVRRHWCKSSSKLRIGGTTGARNKRAEGG